MKKNILTSIGLFVSTIIVSQGLSLPYYSGFDTAPETAGWQQFRLGNDPGAFGWNVGGGGFSASMCVSHDYNVGANTTDTLIDWYVSPALNFTSSGTISFKVKTSGFSAPTPDNCEVYFGTDDPDPATGNYTLIGTLSYMQPQFTWIDTTLSIPFVSDSGYVAFKYKTIGAAWMTYAIDNINIETTASVTENENSSSFLRVFPNPVHHSATISVKSLVWDETTLIHVYDVYGREVKSFYDYPHPVSISKDDFPSGIYFISLEKNKRMLEVEKLIIE